MNQFPGSVSLSHPKISQKGKECQTAECEPSPPTNDGLNVVVSASDDTKTEQTRVVLAKYMALYQDDCDFMTGKILLLL